MEEARLIPRDVWLVVAKYLGGRGIAALSTTCRTYYNDLGDTCVWKVAFLSEYGAADPGDINIHWKQIYMWALEYSAVVRMTPELGLRAPSYWAHPMGRSRAGVVLINSGNAVLTSSLIRWDFQSYLEVNNVMRGLYIVDLLTVDHPGEGAPFDNWLFLILDVRHCSVELPNDEEANWHWEHTILSGLDVGGSTLSIFDSAYYEHPETEAISLTREYLDTGTWDFDNIWNFNPTWIGDECDWETRVRRSSHALASNTDLKNRDYNYFYYLIRRSEGGQAIGMRILTPVRVYDDDYNNHDEDSDDDYDEDSDDDSDEDYNDE